MFPLAPVVNPVGLAATVGATAGAVPVLQEPATTTGAPGNTVGVPGPGPRGSWVNCKPERVPGIPGRLVPDQTDGRRQIGLGSRLSLEGHG